MMWLIVLLACIGLRQGNAAPTEVETFQGFIDALNAGSAHIILKSDIKASDPIELLGDQLPSFISIQGRCGGRSGILGARSSGGGGGCVVTLEEPLLVDGASVWLSDVVLEVADSFKGGAMLRGVRSARVWMTNVVLRGAPSLAVGSSGVLLEGSSCWMQGCTFAGLTLPAAAQGTVLHLSEAATATLDTCNITSSTPPQPSDGSEVASLLFLGTAGAARVRDTTLPACTATDQDAPATSAPPLAETGGGLLPEPVPCVSAAHPAATLFTNQDAQVWLQSDAATARPGQWEAAEAWDAAEGDAFGGLMGDEPDFEQARQALPGESEEPLPLVNRNASPPPPRPSPAAPPSGGNSNNGLVVALITAIVAAVVGLLAVAAVLMVLRRRRRARGVGVEGQRSLSGANGSIPVQELVSQSRFGHGSMSESQAAAVYPYAAGGNVVLAGHPGYPSEKGATGPWANAPYSHKPPMPGAGTAPAGYAAGATPAGEPWAPLQHPPGPHHRFQPYDAAAAPHPAAFSGPPPAPGLAALNAHNLSILEQTTARDATPGPFANPAAVRSKMTAQQGLHDALDSLIISGRLLMGRYSLEQAAPRYLSPSAFVQCATDTAAAESGASVNGAGARVAVKFFLRRAEYEREEQALDTPELASIIDPGGRMRMLSNFDGSLRAPNGYIYPPCAIMPCGRCLRAWLDDPSLPAPDVAQMLAVVGTAVGDAHKAGWVHRNIHPGNIMQSLTHPGHWLLMDWHCSAKIGTCPQAINLEDTRRLMYAAPEDVAAMERGQVATKATAAADVWALGVVAYEVLTRTPVFAGKSGEKYIRDCITGRMPLPWEATDSGAREKLQAMRSFKRSVMLCLERNPHRRPSAAEVTQMWTKLFQAQMSFDSFSRFDAAQELARSQRSAGDSAAAHGAATGAVQQPSMLSGTQGSHPSALGSYQPTGYTYQSLGAAAPSSGAKGPPSPPHGAPPWGPSAGGTGPPPKGDLPGEMPAGSVAGTPEGGPAVEGGSGAEFTTATSDQIAATAAAAAGASAAHGSPQRVTAEMDGASGEAGQVHDPAAPEAGGSGGEAWIASEGTTSPPEGPLV